MRRLIAGFIALLIGISVLVGTPSAATAAGPGSCPEGQQWSPQENTCVVVITPGEDPDDPPGPGGGGGGGEPVCTGPLAPNFCSGDEGWTWSAGRECYLGAYETQPPPGEVPDDWHPPLLIEMPPAGAEDGVWYRCATPSCIQQLALLGGTCGGYPVWLPTGPTISPEDAAQGVFASLTFRAFEIGMAPRVNPEWGHRRTHVGVPVWMWVADRSPETYDGYTITQESGGLTVSGTMRVSSIEWSMGDGTTVVCGTAGQQYQAGFGWRESPDCGHVYSRTSSTQPGDRYPVSATTHWVFEWTAGGASGSIDTSTVSTTEVEVNEMQTVNTSPAG